MLVLAFDTATDVATSALVRDGEVLAERVGATRSLLEDVDTMLVSIEAEPVEIDALVVGIGPGSFTGTRIGLAVARGLALGLGVPASGVPTLDALARAAAGAYPVVDARRREVFVPGPLAMSPDELDLEPGTLCIGNGAVRYRATLERLGAYVPADDDPVHVPHARLHVSVAGPLTSVDEVFPLYVREPDAKVRSHG